MCLDSKGVFDWNKKLMKQFGITILIIQIIINSQQKLQLKCNIYKVNYLLLVCRIKLPELQDQRVLSPDGCSHQPNPMRVRGGVSCSAANLPLMPSDAGCISCRAADADTDADIDADG